MRGAFKTRAGFLVSTRFKRSFNISRPRKVKKILMRPDMILSNLDRRGQFLGKSRSRYTVNTDQLQQPKKNGYSLNLW